MRISDWSSTCALPIWTGGFANAYPHVQPFVAIDDVVAGVAANGVAAIATEDDVAGVIGGHPDTEHGLHPIDPGDTRGVEVASPIRSEQTTTELQSRMRLSSAVLCLKKKPQCMARHLDGQPKA